MLESTFLHIPGVGPQTERALWDQGCRTWYDLLDGLEGYSCGTASKGLVRDQLLQSQASLESGNHQFFGRGLGLKEAWRAFPEFRHSCVYLDIETDGGSAGDSVTTIGLYDGLEYRVFLKDRDLETFRDVISNYSMVVTFFGAGFDLPMLQRRFRGIQFDQIHLDLCPALRRLGLKGGLKKIEKQLGVQRSDEADGLDGWAAVRLWRRYSALGDEEALRTLIAYNREDVVNLERLAEYAYDGLKEQTMPA